MRIELRNKPNEILRIYVQFWIPRLQEYANAEAVFDTGAGRTILDKGLINLLQLPLSKRKSTTVTASGTVDVYTSVLPQLYIGTEIISQIPVSVMNLPEELKVRCIIGMNVLQEFKITIDNLNRMIELSPNPLPKKYFKEDYSITLTSETEREHEESEETISTGSIN